MADLVKIFTKLGLAAKQGFIDLGFGNYKPIDELPNQRIRRKKRLK